MFALKMRRGTDLKPIGELDDYTSMQAIPRHNAVGAWKLTIGADSAKAARLVEGNGLIIRYNGARVMSGDITSVDSAQTRDDGDAGTLTVSGVDDNNLLKQATVWPNPSADDAHQTDGTYKVSGPAETVLRTLVDVNIGPSARTGRRVPDLTLAPDLARGPTVTKQIRQFANLLDVLADIANTAGLGFRIVQVGTGRRFELYEPQDSGVVFSFGRGNLEDVSYSKQPPTCTCAIVVAGGSSSPRVVKEYTRADVLVPGLRIEQFVDRTDVDTGSVDLAAQMDQAADEALTAGARQASLSLTPIDTEQCRYGVQYNVGDRGTAMVRGEALTDTIREVVLNSDSASGATVKPVIATPDATDPKNPLSSLMQVMAGINRRLRSVETRVPQ
ncbi:siphovirus ReqiPepy6 Gp37-like family protein [Actinomadura sp. WMMA1423]|uniref:siphovirus ReqiPepy6 Gp37-like family protein n=1 Tax=Actinomadura sp. WMMA1423 TaxID=2591108 RepID=UPI00197A91DA|nr:siphovirus ReqiPepy6 Gp37-like family protein [Actinomadura sp. WMMA1423]